MMDMGKKSYFVVLKIFWTFCCCSSTSRFLQSFFHGWLNSQTRQANTHSVKNKKKMFQLEHIRSGCRCTSLWQIEEKNCLSIALALLHRSMMCANSVGWGHLLSDAWRQRLKTLFAHCSHNIVMIFGFFDSISEHSEFISYRFESHEYSQYASHLGGVRGATNFIERRTSPTRAHRHGQKHTAEMSWDCREREKPKSIEACDEMKNSYI